MIYILLPAFNEEKSLDKLLPKIDSYFKEIQVEYEIVACDDGSTDLTATKLLHYQATLPIRILKHKLNRGLGETIRDLFEHVAEKAKNDDVVVRMDCDDTHEPEFIKGLMDKLDEGYDVVIGSRFVKGGAQEGLTGYRKIISLMANTFMRILFPIKGLKEYSSGFRAYRASIIKDAIHIFGNEFIQLKGLGFSCTLEKLIKLKLMGARIGEAPMILRYHQKASESKMVASITSFGYIVLTILYYWPFGGWKDQYKKKKALSKPRTD